MPEVYEVEVVTGETATAVSVPGGNFELEVHLDNVAKVGQIPVPETVEVAILGTMKVPSSGLVSADAGNAAIISPNDGLIYVPESVGGGGDTTVQIGTVTLPESPTAGLSVSVLADSTTVLPEGITWDSGGEPTITERMLLVFVWSGDDWVGTYGPSIPEVPEPPDTTAPSVPTGLTATATSHTTIDLEWGASTDAVGVTGYEYRIDGGSAVDAGAGTTETVTGLDPSTEYDFEVRAYDAAGNRSNWSLPATETTDAAPSDSTPPTPGTLAASAITDTSFTLTVSGASDETALHATPYAFSTDNGSNWSAYQSGASFDASGLTAETEYTCVHRVRDAVGNVATGTPITVETDATSPPLLLSDEILALSPAGYWKLDETSGTVAVDYSGNSRNGTYNGAVTLNSVDGAPLFGGGHVAIADIDIWSMALRPSGSTVFALININAIGTRQYFVAKGATGQFEWALEVTAAGAIQVQFHNATGSAILMNEAGGAVPTGEWVAVVMRVPPTPAVGSRPLLHLNSGTPISTFQGSIGSGSFANGTAPITIGSRSGASAFAGGIRHVALFDQQLTETDIGNLVAAAQTEGLIP